MQPTDDTTPDAEAAGVEMTERGGLEALLFRPATVITALVVGALVQEGQATGAVPPPAPTTAPE